MRRSNRRGGAIEKRVALSDKMILALMRDEGTDRLGADKLFDGYAQLGRTARFAEELAEGSIGWKLLRHTRRVLNVLAPPDTLRGRAWRRVMNLFRRAL